MTTAPDFELKNTSGGPLRLSDYQKGGPVVLTFFAPDCPTSALALPFVERLYRRHRTGRARFLGVAQTGKAEAAAFAKTFAVMMPFVLEEAPFATAEAYGIAQIPAVLLLDGARQIQLRHEGFSKKAYQDLADRLASLDGKAPEALFSLTAPIPGTKPGSASRNRRIP